MWEGGRDIADAAPAAALGSLGRCQWGAAWRPAASCCGQPTPGHIPPLKSFRNRNSARQPAPSPAEDDKPTSLPGSPKGPLTPGEASTLDGSSRASSPGPSSSRDCLGGCSACSSSGATSTLRALPADHALAAATPAAVRRGGGGSGASALGAIGAAKQLRASTESLRGVLSLSRAHSCGSSTGEADQ